MRSSETSQMHFVALIDPINEKKSKDIKRKTHRKYQNTISTQCTRGSSRVSIPVAAFSAIAVVVVVSIVVAVVVVVAVAVDVVVCVCVLDR
jgi:Flp pilus assembly protein TadB